MKSKGNLRLQFANAGLTAALIVAGSAAAQTLPKEGSYDFISCWSGVSTMVGLAKTQGAMSVEFSGNTRSITPGGMFDKNSFRCVGLTSNFGGKITGRTVCEAVDMDGDKRLTHFSFSSDGQTIRETVAGTGKYDGIIESGKAQGLGPFPVIKPGTFQDCNRQTGTYKLK